MNKNLGLFLLILIFGLECFALPTQYIVLLQRSEFTYIEAAIRLLSFFTILTNAMVLIASVVLLFSRRSRTYRFFHRNTTLTAITVYILIVGIVYNLLLRPIEHAEGMNAILTEIFHTIVPLLFLIYWIFCVVKQNMSYKAIPYWLIYPLIYVAYTILHGKYTGFYPYPFINITKLGFATAMQNGMFIVLGFAILGFMLIGIGKYTTKDHK